MSRVRRVFRHTVDAIRPLIADEALAARWKEPSALEMMPVHGLAGHLLRAVTSVETYLDEPEPRPEDGEPVTAAGYFARVLTDADLNGPLHQAIRARGEEAAGAGPYGLLVNWDEALGRLDRRLASEAPSRLVKAVMGTVLHLDEYLATRLVELCLHADDLAVSLGLRLPDLPPGATEVAVRVLVDLARLRHGDIAVLPALARRERDHPAALPVL